MVYKFFDKKSSGSGIATLANKFAVDLADMQLISKYNKGIRFFLCVIDIFSKYAWVIPLKDKKGWLLLMLFRKF